MAKIIDVAKRAGVSIATVSRVTNRQGNVKKSTEQKVLEAIKELNYIPNFPARYLKTKRTLTIGMVVPDITNPFFPIVFRGAESVVKQEDYTIILCNTFEDEYEEMRYLSILEAKKVDGILLIKAPPRSGNEQYMQKLNNLPVPIVYVDRLPKLQDIPAVVADNIGGGYAATTHLIKLGHRNIAIITVQYPLSVHRERLQGYVKALREHNIPINRFYIKQGASTIEEGTSLGHSLINMKDRPTAIFVTNYKMTIGLMRALEMAGLQCPEDISIVGYDDFEWENVFHPRLTVVAQPARQMGQTAAQLLIKILRDGVDSLPNKRVILSSELKIRESCGIYRQNKLGKP
ncbi:LacI family transcriptional regulator [bacterium (candidate division B38) B3_B38]|nr:MAG: LacI family transcriptional regulator [bacterium (candidate division B38) B3_B38]